MSQSVDASSVLNWMLYWFVLLHLEKTKLLLSIPLSIIKTKVVLEFANEGQEGLCPCRHCIKVWVENVGFEPFPSCTTKIGQSIADFLLFGEVVQSVKEQAIMRQGTF